MKITNVATEMYRWPRHKTITNGLHTYTQCHPRAGKNRTDEGLIGIGLGAAGPIERATVERLEPLLVGEDPLNVGAPVAQNVGSQVDWPGGA